MLAMQEDEFGAMPFSDGLSRVLNAAKWFIRDSAVSQAVREVLADPVKFRALEAQLRALSGFPKSGSLMSILQWVLDNWDEIWAIIQLFINPQPPQPPAVTA